LHLNFDNLDKFIQEFEKDAKALKEELLRYCWFMRGGLSFAESLNLTLEDREIIVKIIEKNMETTKESGLPFF